MRQRDVREDDEPSHRSLPKQRQSGHRVGCPRRPGRLDAVLAHAKPDELWCLGDIVGYGPDPSAVIARLRELDSVVAVSGNHDAAAIGALDASEFNQHAATRRGGRRTVLTSEEKRWLSSLPQVVALDEGFTLVHGSLNDPWREYLDEPTAIARQLRLQETKVGLFGHTHRPGVGTERGWRNAVDGSRLELNRFRNKLVINPGSVGQPRDGGALLSYALYQRAAQTVTWSKLCYDVRSTQRKILAVGLPAFNARRLDPGAPTTLDPRRSVPCSL